MMTLVVRSGDCWLSLTVGVSELPVEGKQFL